MTKEGSESEVPPQTESSKGGGRWAAVARRRLPVLEWGRRYDRLTATADLVAGVTLGLTLVPQGIAYASLAGLPVQYGLYSSFIGTILYVFLGTVKEVSIGPTSLMALLTLHTMRGLPLTFLPLLTLLSGCVVTVCALLRLGFLVELISPGVSSGFTSGTALIIAATQTKGLLGLSYTAETLWDNVSQLARHAAAASAPDAALAAVCCVALLLLRKLKDVKVAPQRRVLRKTLWLVSIGRNALVVCGASLVAYCTHRSDRPLFKLSGRVAAGLPSLSLPAMSAELTAADGSRHEVGLVGMVQELGWAVLVLPVVMVLANIAIATSFSSGRPVDATQEMLTLGVCNVVGSLVGAMPTCGAFTRSAVSHSSGVRTPAAGLYSGLITLIALSFMTQYFYYIPRACLSSVLICAVIFMIDVSIVRTLWRRSRSELAVLAVTLSTALTLSVELAVPVGAAAAAAAVLARLASAPVTHHRLKLSNGVCVVRIRPPAALIYLNTSAVARRLTALLGRAGGGGGGGGGGGVGGAAPVLLDCSAVIMVDYAALQMLERQVKMYAKADQKLILYNASSEMMCKLEDAQWTSSRQLRARTELDALAAACDPAPAAPAAPVALLDPAPASAAPADPDETDSLLTTEQKNTMSMDAVVICAMQQKET